jgi:hypothetical protein
MMECGSGQSQDFLSSATLRQLNPAGILQMEFLVLFSFYELLLVVELISFISKLEILDH